MFFVYILESESEPSRYYTGFTEDIERRLQDHNAGRVPHTAKYAPWRYKSYPAFADKASALAFERYLKSHSGRAFAKKRL